MATKKSKRQAQSSTLGTFSSNSFSNYFKALTPQKVWQILEDAKAGNIDEQFRLFEQMEKFDTEIKQAIDKRKRAALSLNAEIYPWDTYRDKDGNIISEEKASNEDIENTEIIKEVVRNIPNFEDIVLNLGHAIGNGIALLECSNDERGTGWHKQGNYIIPEYKLRSNEMLAVDKDNKNHLLFKGKNGQTEEFWKYGWIIHKHSSSSGYATDSGIFLTLVWTYLFRQWAQADVVEFLDIYGLPMILGRYEDGDTKEDLDDQNKFKNAVFNLSKNARAIFPNSMEIDVLQNVGQGRVSNYIEWLDYNAKAIQKCILGATLTSDVSNTGSYGAAEIHKGETFSLVISDVKQYESTLRDQLIYPISIFNTNLFDKNRMPKIFFDTKIPDDKDRFLKEVDAMYKMGYELKEEFVEERFGGMYQKREEVVEETEEEKKEPTTDEQAIDSDDNEQEVDVEEMSEIEEEAEDEINVDIDKEDISE